MDKTQTARRGRGPRERGSVLHIPPARVHRLALQGELGHDSAVGLEAAIDDLCAAGVGRLVLDLSGLTAIDRTGVCVVAMRCRLCMRQGVEVELVCVPPAVTAAFDAAGLSEELPVRENSLAPSVS
jgi:anti-anti-sigma factor